MDAGYDVTRLAWVLRDLPVELVGRIRSDRVMRLPKPPRMHGINGRPPKHGPEFRFAKPETWPEPAIITATDTVNYGKAEAQAWDRVHPRLTHRSAWLEHDGELPIVEGTLVRLKVEHLPKEREAPPVWLWSSKTGAAPADVNLWWQVFLRRFDLEHTFRFGKQTLGWTTPKVRTPEAADRWTWLLVVAHTQLRLARPLATDLRRPWEKPAKPERLTPARVRRGFRNIHFADGLLFCIAVDAVHGPQVTLWGRELTACVPADLERFLLHAHDCGVLDVRYGPRGNPGANGLGLVVRVQEAAGNVVTRPVMVGRAWADRCTDDWEGAIPECEWVGRQWMYPGHSEHWPPPGYAPNWHDWQPPF